MSIATKLGVVHSQSFKRLPQEQRGDPELLSLVVGTPWAPVPSQADVDKIPMTIRVDAGAVVPTATLPSAIAPRGPELLGRRVYLRRKKELERYVYTDGCP